MLLGITKQKEIVRVSDNFNRTDSNLTMGSAQTGQNWQVDSLNHTCVFGIESNQAKCVTLDAANRNQAIIETKLSDFILKCSWPIATALQRIVFRQESYYSHFYLHYETGKYKLIERSGSSTNLGEYTTAQANGDYFMIICRGQSIEIFINGISRISATSAAHLTGTKHGIECYSDLTPRWDNFIVERL